MGNETIFPVSSRYYVQLKWGFMSGLTASDRQAQDKTKKRET